MRLLGYEQASCVMQAVLAGGRRSRDGGGRLRTNTDGIGFVP